MRVFVTGATGFIGSAIVRELLSAGHDVLGLARSDASAASLAKTGAAVHRGELADVDSLAAAARAADGVIHTAFIHDFSRYQDNARIDREALAAMTAALEGTGKPLVSTSGTALLTPGRLGTEHQAADRSNPGGFRTGAEEIVLAAAERGVRSSLVRLPPTVHGEGDHGFVPMLIDTARRTGASAYLGEGANRWAAVHRLDAARVYVLALEKAEPGTRLHGVAEEGIPFRAIAEAVGAAAGVPVRSLPADEAADHFGFLAHFAGIDNPVSSALTREWLGWQPREIGLLDETYLSPEASRG